MPRQRKRKQEIAEFDFEALPIAKCRDNGDEWPRRESKRITVDEAYSAVEEMLPRRLNIIIDSVLKSQAIRSLPPSEDDFFGEMEKTKFAILNAVRMPRGIMITRIRIKATRRGLLRSPYSKGQMLSFRDSTLMSPTISKTLRRLHSFNCRHYLLKKTRRSPSQPRMAASVLA
jgi:hypothetical protein